MLSIFGNWSNPIDSEDGVGLSEEVAKRFTAKVVERFNHRCVYCGFRSAPNLNHPNGMLKVCLSEKGLSREEKNCIPLCGFCVRLNSVESLIDSKDKIGTFVEMPSIKQSDLNNIVRIAYCYQTLAETEENKPKLYGTKFHRELTSLFDVLNNIPNEWSEYDFDGSPESLKNLLENYTGYTQSDKEILYIDRLRFIFSPVAFAKEINFWMGITKQSILKNIENNKEVQ
jgi:hypothetical protein